MALWLITVLKSVFICASHFVSDVGVFFIHFLFVVFALLLMFTLLSSQSLNCALDHKHHVHIHPRLQNHFFLELIYH